MRRINSFEELDKLIMKHLKRGVYTNCFIGKEEFTQEIERKSMFYHEYDGGILLFRNMGEYFKMNFYINSPEVELDMNFDKNVVTEIVCKPEFEYSKIVQLFEKNGMKLKLKRVRLLNENSNVDIISSNIEKADIKDYEKIIKLLRENFDKYIGCIPVEEKLKMDIADGNIYCYKVNQSVIGLLHISNNANISTIKHLVVDKEYRSKGIAKMLISKYLIDVGDCKKYVWTGEENRIALNTYFSMGYKLDGYFSYVMMR